MAADLWATEERIAAGLQPVEGGGFVAVKREAPTPAQIAQRREIRDLARGLDRHELRERYLRAVSDGSDPELVAAFEEAPAAFPLIDAQTRERARALRIKASPFVGAIARQTAMLRAHDLIVGAIEREAAEMVVMDPGPASRGENVR